MYKQAEDEKENELLYVVHSLFSIRESQFQAAIASYHLLVKLLRYKYFSGLVCTPQGSESSRYAFVYPSVLICLCVSTFI